MNLDIFHILSFFMLVNFLANYNFFISKFKIEKEKKRKRKKKKIFEVK
jgi:hypothetical protein